MRRRSRLRPVLLICLVAVGLAGCVVAPPRGPGRAWVPGHYNAHGGWVPGHWR
jgi:hypothetical protein